MLAKRGQANGAEVEFWDNDQPRELIPEARTPAASFMEPNTAVVKPISVLRRLRDELVDEGSRCARANMTSSQARAAELALRWHDAQLRHLFNCRVAGRSSGDDFRGR